MRLTRSNLGKEARISRLYHKIVCVKIQRYNSSESIVTRLASFPLKFSHFSMAGPYDDGLKIDNLSQSFMSKDQRPFIGIHEVEEKS